MNLIFLIGALSRGGMERQMCILMDELARRGHQIRLITFLPFADAYKYDQRIERLRFDGGWKISVMMRLFCYFHSKEGNCDCIIAYGRLSCEVGILTNIFHCFKFIAGERNYTTSFSQKDRFVLWLFRYADRIVTNSYSQKTLLSQRYPMYEKKLVCIINYTDTGYFSPCSSSKQIGSICIIGVFARFHPQKNGIRFAEAISQICKNSQGKNVVVKWYGAATSDKERSYRIEVSNYIQLHGLKNNFILMPPTDNVRDAIYECDAICLPSLHEGFSNSIAESISCGKIVLASNVSDNHVMVEDGVNGFLFDPNDIKSINDAFDKFLSLTVVERKKMERLSREKALSLFNLQRFGDNYEKIIYNIVHKTI